MDPMAPYHSLAAARRLAEAADASAELHRALEIHSSPVQRSILEGLLLGGAEDKTISAAIRVSQKLLDTYRKHVFDTSVLQSPEDRGAWLDQLSQELAPEHVERYRMALSDPACLLWFIGYREAKLDYRHVLHSLGMRVPPRRRRSRRGTAR